MKILFFFLLILSISYQSQAQQIPVESLSETAGLVFQGTVIEKSHRMSEGEGESMPHTFVTYKVERVFKGNAAEDTFTLRFLGGPINDYEFIDIGDMPLMDIGDTDILFVSGNSESYCPLVGCSRGRYRYIDGLMFNELGQTLLLNEDNKIIEGPAVNLDEVNNYQLSESMSISFEYDVSEGEQEKIYNSADEYLETEAYQSFTSLDIGSIGVIVEDAVYAATQADNYTEPPAEKSADPNQPIINEPLVEYESVAEFMESQGLELPENHEHPLDEELLKDEPKPVAAKTSEASSDIAQVLLDIEKSSHRADEISEALPVDQPRPSRLIYYLLFGFALLLLGYVVYCRSRTVAQ